MSGYQALYRKWRPMRFEDISGQKQVSDTLKTAIANGRTTHAYLFCGTRGTGKTSTAKIFSRAVNCEAPINGEPCNECASCRGILDGSILDVYEMDAASNRGVENIREIRDEVIYTPVGCKYKVYIIDEVHMLTAEAFNALLKTLEEPPAHAIFILATTEPHKIPATILSRCQRFDFRRISVDDIAGRIKKITDAEEIKITPDAIEAVAELGDGSMRDAISILDRCASFGQGELTEDKILDIMGVVGTSRLFDIGEAVLQNDAKTALRISADILREGKEAQNLIENMISHFRAMLICKTTDNSSDLLEKTEFAAKKYATQAEGFSVERILYSIKTLSDYLAQSKWMSNPKLSVEQAAIRLCMPTYSTDVSALLARIEKLETMVANLSSGVAVQPVRESENKPKEDEPLPPWDVANEEKPVGKAPEETPDKVVTPPNRVDKDGSNEIASNANVGNWDLWTDALSEIKKESKMLYAFLYTAEAKRRGNTIEIEVGGDVAYGRISTPEGKEYLSKLFSRVAEESLSVDVFIKGERGAEQEEKRDGLSIMDLADKKSEFGDKIDIV